MLKGRISKALISRDNQLFARHSGDGDENAEVDLVIKEVAHVQLCQSSNEFSEFSLCKAGAQDETG